MDVGEMAWCLPVLAARTQDQFPFPNPHGGSQWSVIPVLGDLLISFDLHGCKMYT